MPIVLKCGKCQGRFKAPESLAGKRVRCKCGTVLAVPPIAQKTTLPEPELPEPEMAEPQIADLSGLIDGSAFDTGGCPGCGAALADSAIICTACGFNRKTGQRVSVRVEEGSDAAETGNEKKSKASKPKPVRVVVDESGAGSAAIGKLVKILVLLGVLGGVAYGGYMIKEAVSLDPAKQSREALAKIKGGMTIAQVVSTLEKTPKEVWAMQDGPKNHLGISFPKDAQIGYADNFLKHHGPKKLKYGFRFVYMYSIRDQLHIHFDPKGIVTESELFDPMKILNM